MIVAMKIVYLSIDVSRNLDVIGGLGIINKYKIPIIYKLLETR